jgi:hypothetical protein
VKSEWNVDFVTTAAELAFAATAAIKTAATSVAKSFFMTALLTSTETSRCQAGPIAD